MLNLLRKKIINKMKYSRSCPDPDFLDVTFSNHVISFSFLPISRHLQNSGKPKNWLIRSRRISSNWGENFWLSQWERFLEPIEKSPYIVNYLWAVYSIILMITKIFIFTLLYFTSVLLLIIWSQPSQ